VTTILVVEDEALIADDIQRTLIRLGYDVPVTVGTGEAAIASAGTMRPGLVLMDIRLRGKMDGIEAATEIRSRWGTPIVYLTSHSDEATLTRAVETLPYGYLLKPFNDRELRTAIEVALSKYELESRLAARERWFSTTLRSIGDAVIATDHEEVITFMNIVAEKLTGWGADAVGKPVSEVFRVVDNTGAAIASPAGSALGNSFAVELPPSSSLLPKTGQQIPIDDSAAPIIDEQGAVLGAVIVFRDITKRRRLEERLAQTERLVSLGSMAAGMAHEINNPLAYVMANVEISRGGLQSAADNLRALEGAPADPRAVAHLLGELVELQSALKDAAEGAERVRGIVHDLKTFARVEDSKLDLVDLPEALEVAVRMTEHTISHHARIRRSFGTTPFVEANGGQLGQVFINLLLNAAQAIGEGNAERNEIFLSTFTDAGGQAVVEVRDTGPGIRPEVLPNIFDPFFTTKPIGSGMGLGLAICHNIIVTLGGQLTAESPAGGGALFRVILPAARSTLASKPKASPMPSAGTRGKVLIVDDEPGVAMAMARMLRKAHDVTVVAEGLEALRRIADGEVYDVIFCDLMMPNHTGMDVYEALAVANPEQARRMVFMTGGTFTERSRTFLDSSPNVHITKPFGVEAVLAIVHDHVK
jgi:PAS domain S-box-containing protein